MRRLANQPLNGGSSMTMSSKGLKGPNPHRLKMPWTKRREVFDDKFFDARDKTILDGHELNYDMERSAQRDPIDVLKAAVAQRKYLTSTGYNVAQIAAHLPYHGRGQKFYREEWKDGTYDKYFTLANIEIERDTGKAEVWGYITFHGETSLDPVKIEYANLAGWYVDFDEAAAVPFGQIVKAPPSIGTEVPVDPKKYKLKAYPFYTPPNPKEYVLRLLKDRGVLPDVNTPGQLGNAGGDGPGTTSSDGTVEVNNSDM